MPGIIPPGHPLALPSGGSVIPGWLAKRLGTMATLGLWNFSHPGQSQEYYSELGHELDPRTAQGLVALGSMVFGPRLDDPAITAIKTPEGDLVPLPRGPKAGQRVTSNPVRNLKHDFANALLARAIRTRESEPVSAHIESVAHRASLQAAPEDAHSYVEGNDTTRGEPHAPPAALHQTLRPAQAALLRMLLARERAA